MAAVDVRNRLQPALLDRLTDDSPGDRLEAEDHRVMSKAQLRQAVLRDLGALFNAVQPLGAAADAYPLLGDSVLNFGLPPLSGQLASKLDIGTLEGAIRQAIVRFEPRILPDTLEVRALESTSVLDTHNVVEFEIRGHLWSQPVPLEILLRTQLDLEAGQVEVRDAAGVVPSKVR
ncbi:MAG TPA: type VI secretion system baseplate subunit TssE [Albitalea sp.]|nr:type VI secretion system baseplate subunit TssE [Albitalea sp.]